MRPIRHSLPALLLTFTATLSGQGAGYVQLRDWPPPSTTTAPLIPCNKLRSLTSLELSVISAEPAPATTEAPAHCRVFLMAQPELHMEVRLPANWNGRFYMFGNGGWAGEAFDTPRRVANHARALRAGFATASTDTGHSAAQEPGASFALNRQKLLDFGFRSLHVTAQTAKMLVHNYYGAAPSRSYYDGCSQGGRQGLTLAQRFPDDFDGIVAGAPALYNSRNMVTRAYWMKGQDASPLPPEKLPLLAESVYAKCDAADGLKDGLITDPLRCNFQTARDLPRCPASQDSPTCFTAPEIAAIERIYTDVTRQGKRFFPGWPVGAEVVVPGGNSGWLGQVIRGADGRSVWANYAQEFFRYMAAPGSDAAQAIRNFDIDKDIPRLEYLHQTIDASDPDLTAFRQRGGKLLMYFGWADPQLNPRVAVEYYEQVAAQMGSSTPEFARLFMVPGMFHCGGGVGANTFDAVTPLIQWVEAGVAPQSIQASQVSGGKTVRTRPLCPHPQIAKYKGAGNVDDAANFLCAAP